jgi:hypothetical protein
MDVLEMLSEECPYDMEPGEYWVLLRELWEHKRKPMVTVSTRLYFIASENQWNVLPLPVRFGHDYSSK